MSLSGLEATLEVQLPSCALSCVTESTLNSTCPGFDRDCICPGTLMSIAGACIAGSCDTRAVLSTQNVTSSICGIAPSTDYSYEPLTIVFLTIACIAFLLRGASRVVAKVHLWWDDLGILLALLSVIALSGMIFHLKTIGLGLEIWAVVPDNISQVLFGLYIIGILYTAARYLVRASILLFLLRIFAISRAKIIILVTLAIIVAEGITFVVATIFQCSPVSYFWLSWDGEERGTCVNLQSLLWANVVFGIIGDIWMIALPVAFISRLQLGSKQKFFASIMFAVGIAVTGLNIARIPELKKGQTSTDTTLDQIPIVKLSVLENTIGITCACLPSIWGLFKSFTQSVRGSVSKESSFRPINVETGSYQADSTRTGRHAALEMSHSDIILTTTVNHENQVYAPPHDVPLDELRYVGKNHNGVEAEAWA